MSADGAIAAAAATLLRRRTLQRQLATLVAPARTTSLLVGRAPGPGALDAACAGVSLVLERLVEAIVAGEVDPRRFEESVAALSGLGPGLTPTGDDVLVALLVAGQHLAGLGLVPEGGHARLALAVAASPPGRTTPTAEHWLAEACDGRAPAPLARLIWALGNPEIADDDIAERCTCLVATGAHSGADWLAGVLALATRCCESANPGPTSLTMTTSGASSGDTATIHPVSLPAVPCPLSPVLCALESHRE